MTIGSTVGLIEHTLHSCRENMVTITWKFISLFNQWSHSFSGPVYLLLDLEVLVILWVLHTEQYSILLLEYSYWLVFLGGETWLWCSSCSQILTTGVISKFFISRSFLICIVLTHPSPTKVRAVNPDLSFIHTWRILCVYPLLSSFNEAVLICSHSSLDCFACVSHVRAEKWESERERYKGRIERKIERAWQKSKWAISFLSLFKWPPFWFFSDVTTCWVLITGLIMLKNPNRGN